MVLLYSTYYSKDGPGMHNYQIPTIVLFGCFFFFFELKIETFIEINNIQL